jgi:hypothetical protein
MLGHFAGMPLDATPSVDEKPIGVIHSFRKVGPITWVRPLEQHRHGATEWLDVMVNITEQRPDALGGVAFAAIPRKRCLLVFNRHSPRKCRLPHSCPIGLGTKADAAKLLGDGDGGAGWRRRLPRGWGTMLALGALKSIAGPRQCGFARLHLPKKTPCNPALLGLNDGRQPHGQGGPAEMTPLIFKAIAFVAIAVIIASLLGWGAWLGFMVDTVCADLLWPAPINAGRRRAWNCLATQ